MRIAVISDLECEGGAAVAATNLVTALREEGQNVFRIVARADLPAAPWPRFVCEGAWKRTLPRRLACRFLPRAARMRLFHDVCRNEITGALRTFAPDVIHLHNYHWALEPGWPLDLPETLRQIAPVVWTLHDLWSVTGRCAYPYDCRRFTTNCDASCPTAAEYPSLSPSRIQAAWATKTRFRSGGITPVAPSSWLAREAQQGGWSEMEVIPYGIDPNRFFPVDRNDARNALGIDNGGLVLLASMHRLNDPRKGMRLLLEALDQLAQPERAITLLTLGGGKLEQCPAHIRAVELGFVADDETKRNAYAACDAYVHPALADNLPNTVLEAMACARPVVAFAAGGVPDMVRHGETGLLAKAGDVGALTEALREAAAAPERLRAMGEAGLRRAQEEYSPVRQAQRYIRLYHSLRTRPSKRG